VYLVSNTLGTFAWIKHISKCRATCYMRFYQEGKGSCICNTVFFILLESPFFQ